MKDALGHGSNGSGDGAMLDALRARLTHVTSLKGGGIPQSSNASASAALMSAMGKTMIKAPLQTWNDRSPEREYNRNLVTRIRNGEVGRKGM